MRFILPMLLLLTAAAPPPPQINPDQVKRDTETLSSDALAQPAPGTAGVARVLALFAQFGRTLVYASELRSIRDQSRAGVKE